MSDCQYNVHNPKSNDSNMQAHDTERLLDQLIDCLYSIEGDADTSSIDTCLENLKATGALCEDEFDIGKGLQYFHDLLQYQDIDH